MPQIEAAGRTLSFTPGTTLEQKLLAILPTLGFDDKDTRNIAKRSAQQISRDLRAGKVVNLPGFVPGVTPGGLLLSNAEERRRVARAPVPPRPSAGLSTASRNVALEQLNQQLALVQAMEPTAFDIARGIDPTAATEAALQSQINLIAGAP